MGWFATPQQQSDSLAPANLCAFPFIHLEPRRNLALICLCMFFPGSSGCGKYTEPLPPFTTNRQLNWVAAARDSALRVRVSDLDTHVSHLVSPGHMCFSPGHVYSLLASFSRHLCSSCLTLHLLLSRYFLNTSDSYALSSTKPAKARFPKFNSTT